MKFAEHLGAHITPEWRKQYIQYEEMKTMLCEACEEAPSSEIVEPEIVDRYFAKFDETFFTFCEKELIKINIFYSEKLAEATRKISTLKSELTVQNDNSDKSGRFATLFQISGSKTSLPPRKLQDLKLAFSEYYLSLVLLQNYQNLNYTGFRKILKKHDKNLNTDAGSKWRAENVDSAHFYVNKDIDKLIQDTENTFINDLESGDRTKAMKRLRVPPLGDKQSPWTTFKLGLFSGAFTILVISVVLSAIFHDFSAFQDASVLPFVPGKEMIAPNVSDWRVVVRLYRGPLLLIVFMFLMGINVYGWRSSGVNHVLIFELDPRNHLSEQHLMELAAIFGVIWTLSVLSFLYSDYLSIPAYFNPLALVVIMIVFMLNPTRTFRYEARFWMLLVLGRVVCAPFFYVGFADFWIGDQLNSLATALNDFYYLICFYTNNNATINNDWQVAVNLDVCNAHPRWIAPIVACLPAWFRFAQCLRRYRDTGEAFPHLVNAGKYSTTFFIMLFLTLSKSSGQEAGHDPYFYVWIASAIVGSCYTYTWDIKMDWGFMDFKNAGENVFLREEVVYSPKFYYYFAIVEDLVLRLGWAITLLFQEYTNVDPDIVASVLAALEIFRRFVWNFFRLENEHLNNCGKFRAVRDISVAPIDASDQAQIIRMMDEEDGVDAVRKRKGPTSGIGKSPHGNSGISVPGIKAGTGRAVARKLQRSELLRPLLIDGEKPSVIVKA